MRKGKRQRLEAAGWTVGSTQEFLGLTDAEAILVDIHAALAMLVNTRRAVSRTSVSVAGVTACDTTRASRANSSLPPPR